ncbi:MAG: DUF4097 family beta strand repeat-containing protein [Eubacteriales bacterium]
MSKLAKIIILSVIVAALCVALVWGIAIGNRLFLPFGAYFNSDNGGQSVKQTEFESDAQGIKNLNLDFVSEQINVVMTNEAKIRIEETSSGKLDEDEIMQCSVNGDTLLASSGFHNKVWFSWGNFREIRVTLYLPASYKNNIGLHTVSGEISAQDLNATGLKIDTTAGRIDASNMQADTADVSSISGEITLRNCKAGKIDLHETSGAIAFSGGTYESVTAHSTSGEIMLDAEHMQSIDAGSTSGSVTVSVDEMPVKIYAGTVSGSVTLKLPENDGFTLKHSSVSGGMNNDFAMANGVYKNGQNSVVVGTTSGGVNIIKK